MQKASKMRESSVDELKALSLDLSKEIYKVRNELKTARKLEKPHLLKHLKKDRARALTVLREKSEANS
ncbi:MAG: 50S ribosomal protein L29 [Chlamydiae bacterium]|nr:50S ribosomal protein L29 [Chlamydiota bacterium]